MNMIKEKEKEIIWSDIYKDEYSQHFKDFYNFINSTEIKYKNLSKEQISNIGRQYFDFYEETIEMFQYFFCYNCFFIKEFRLIVAYILSCNILKNNLLFYELYLEMKNLKNKKFQIAQKFLKQEYVTIFSELNNFLQERTIIEDSYAM